MKELSLPPDMYSNWFGLDVIAVMEKTPPYSKQNTMLMSKTRFKYTSMFITELTLSRH